METRSDLTRIVLAVLFIGGLMAASLWVLQPFLGALIWAVMIVVSTWGAMRSIERMLGGRRWAAVTVMTVLLLLILVVPLTMAIGTVVGHIDLISGWAKDIGEFKVPPPPSWLAGLPFVGESAASAWQQVAAGGIETLGAKLSPYATATVKWFVGQIGNFGVLFIQFLLTVVAAAVLYAHGEGAAEFALAFGRRLAGEQGENVIRLSGQAIRGVALGVVVTAFVQALIGGVGLAIAGVPFATVLTALMFLLAVAQIGAVPVLVIPIIWLYWSGAYGMGTFLLVIAIVAGTLDNVLRPFLIKKGADLPLLLILVGVIGGLVSFGLIGIFVGPVVLAVTYTLLNAWISSSSRPS